MSAGLRWYCVGTIWVLAGSTSDDEHAVTVSVDIAAKMAMEYDDRMRPNENKISDGWRGSASLRVERRTSWKVRSRDCQPFAASQG
jgi:hypothetical protein